ncbi:MAG: VCBS repeat-containing protein [Bacteroidales bacterium]|nr:VCBS repeat-containing protein [Bacteroidales bacterium]
MRKYICTLLLMAALGHAAVGQNGNPVPEAREDNTVVGAIGGTVDVSAIGSATYTVPIQVPEGIGGIQPALSVGYNNVGGNGLLGWCWDMQGISKISRTGKSQACDDAITGVSMTNADRFLLDGQRLMSVNWLYGDNEAQYRTYYDSQAKIVSYTQQGIEGPAKFKVWLANGNIAYYGYTSDSRIKLQETSKVCYWLLNRVEDRNGNYMEYHYKPFNGACHVLDWIKYTANDNAGVSHAYTVHFDYVVRTDKEISFVGDNTNDHTALLTAIRINHGSVELYRYSFSYHAPQNSVGYYYNRLKQIDFTCGTQSYHPTLIEWGDNDYNETYHDHWIIGNMSDYSGRIKFPGDFNGDGYTDVIVFHPDAKGVNKAKIYLNDGVHHDNVWFQSLRTINVSDDIDWIYVGDYNGDGLDDFICAARNRTFIGKDHLTLNPYISVLSQNGQLSFETPQVVYPDGKQYLAIRKKYKECMLMGDFIGSRKQCFLVQEMESDRYVPRLFYLSYNSGRFTFRQLDNGMVLDVEKMFACDFNGDGLSEIYYSDAGSNRTGLLRLKSDLSGYETVSSSFLSPWHQVFPGDFNGDGKPDVLSYAKDGNGQGSWYINLFKETALHAPTLKVRLSDIGLDDPGKHGFSLKYMQHDDYRFITVSDYNGDGKSDIAVITDQDKLRILYAPVSFVQVGSGYEACFASMEEYQLSTVGLDGAPYNSIVVGNFNGRENVSMFTKNLIMRRKPITNRYTVTKITDGMGNLCQFEYDYLMPDLRNPGSENFYRFTPLASGSSAAYNQTCALPMKGLKKVKQWNIHNPETVSATSYQYKNAVMDKKGLGFVGFQWKASQYALSGQIQSRTEQEYEFVEISNLDPIYTDYMALAEERTLNQYGAVISKTEFENEINVLGVIDYSLVFWFKVFTPMVKKTVSYSYDPDQPQQLIRKTIAETLYEDFGENYIPDLPIYTFMLKPTRSRQGVTGNASAASVSDCEFQTLTETEYVTEGPNEVNTWTLNRPRAVRTVASRAGCPNEDVKNLTTYSYYYGPNAFLVLRMADYPGGVETNSDPLATINVYKYTVLGQKASHDLSDLAGDLPSAYSEWRYSTDGRFLVKHSNPANHAVEYEYDNDYGYLKKQTDCNGLVTNYITDPLGVSTLVVKPDGTQSYSETVWVQGDDNHAPAGACYYEMSRSTGSGETRVYYDATGKKLRSVVPSMGDVMVYKDYIYNDKNLLYKESMPYFEDTPSSSIMWTTFQYDSYNRLVLTETPDGLGSSIWYRGLSTQYVTWNDPNIPKVTTKRVDVTGRAVENIDENGTSVYYDYYPDGQLKWSQVGNQQNTRICVEYDNARNRTMLHDPNYGIVRSTYNAYGQLVRNESPKHDITEYEYDEAGRTTRRTESNIGTHTADVTQWRYSENDGTKGLLEWIFYNGKEQVIHYSYDGLCRLKKVDETRQSQSFSTSYTYDYASRVATVAYPSGFVLRKGYHANGYLETLSDIGNNELWRTNGMDAFGHITSNTAGGRYITKRNFDLRTGRLNVISTLDANNFLQNLSYEYDILGNLAARFDHARNMEERFSYDPLDRLTGITLNGTLQSTIAYDALGRMTHKEADGLTVFTSAAYGYTGPDGQLRPHAISSAAVDGTPFATNGQAVTYTMYDKAETITQGGRTLTYRYGYDRQRVSMVQTLNDGEERRKDYVGHCERVTENGVVRWLTYLSGPGGVFAVVEQRDGYRPEVHYVFKDHLGSWTTVADAYGQVIAEQSFDAWGNPRHPDTWLNYTAPELAEGPMFDRGFTGHEHLTAFGLINMNGRMYDPVMSSFLSVDNYVQNPDFSQNFNRYAYCLNNPLKYTDPSGESILAVSMIVGAAVCAYIGGTAANGWNYNPCSWAWDGKTWAGIGIGAVVGAGVGAAFAYAAPCLASTAFMSHFGASGAVASYTMTGFATLGAGGYAAGYAGGMLYSNGDTRYSHLSGVQGFKVGATVGALAGQLAGDIVNYKPPKEVKISIQPESKWDGCYYQGSNEEFRQMMLESSKYFGVETKGYYTSRGYYFEPITGDVAYKVCNMPWEEFIGYKYGNDGRFRYNLDYNCIVEGETPFFNNIAYCYRYTKMYADRDGRLYIYPEGNYPSQVYTAFHVHPSSGCESASDMEQIFWMGVNGVIFGWNGCKHYYYPPW